MDGALARVIVGPTPGGAEQSAGQPRAERHLSVVAQPREATGGVAETVPPEGTDRADLADTQELPLARVMPLPVNRENAADAAQATGDLAGDVTDTDDLLHDDAVSALAGDPDAPSAPDAARTRDPREPDPEELAETEAEEEPTPQEQEAADAHVAAWADSAGPAGDLFRQ